MRVLLYSDIAVSILILVLPLLLIFSLAKNCDAR